MPMSNQRGLDCDNMYGLCLTLRSEHCIYRTASHRIVGGLGCNAYNLCFKVIHSGKNYTSEGECVELMGINIRACSTRQDKLGATVVWSYREAHPAVRLEHEVGGGRVNQCSIPTGPLEAFPHVFDVPVET